MDYSSVSKFLDPQNVQTIVTILGALGITGALAKWKTEISSFINRLWVHLFYVKQVVEENNTLIDQTKALSLKLKFVESSRDDFKGFVDDLNIRFDHLSEEFDAARKDLLHVKNLLEEERNEVEKVEAEREVALLWGRQLLRQIKTLGIEPVSEEPKFGNNITQTIIITKENGIEIK